MTAKVILNSAHSLLPAQVEQLDKNFPRGWEIVPVPEQGWSKDEQHTVAFELKGDVVFASPVPLLLALVAAKREAEKFIGFELVKEGKDPLNAGRCFIFHNDRRVAKEVPDGKGGVRVIHTVAPDGWELIGI